MSCTKAKDPENRSLRIHLPVVNLVLDPQKMEDAYSMAIVGQIHRGLFRYDTTGTVLSDLADSWTEAPDHRSYRIKLRPAKFSDGTPIQALHVQMTFARMFRLGASMAGDLDSIGGAERFKKEQDLSKFGVAPVAADTIEFRLSKPSAIFLKQLAVADCAILKLADYRQDPDLSSAGAFSGPYRVRSSLQNGEVTVEKWRADPADSPRPPERIVYFMTNEKPVAIALAGLTDTLDHDRVEPSEKANLQAHGWAPAPTEISGELFVLLNPGEITEEARKRMFGAVRAADLMTIAPKDSYRPAYGLIPFGLPGELTQADVQDMPAPSQASLPKALTVRLDFEVTSDLERKLAELLQSRWAALNIHAELNPLPKGEKLKRLFGKKSQVIIGRKTMDYPDGFSVLGYFKGNYDSNYFFVNDPAIDYSLQGVLEIFDARDREAKYREIQKQILKKWTVIPLLFGSEASGLWSSKVKSVPAHPFGYQMLSMESVEMVK